MTTDDPAVKGWRAAMGFLDPEADARDAAAELGRAFAEQTLVLVKARRERDSLARRLAVRWEAQSAAVALVQYALHLRMHGERAPGGTETWAEFDRRAEEFLRSLPGGWDGETVPGALFGADAGEPWQHGGVCSWPERACTGHLPSYPPVQVPENTGKHPGESGETGARLANRYCPACVERCEGQHAACEDPADGSCIVQRELSK